MSTTSIQLDTKKVLQQLSNMDEIAIKNSWVITYDPDSDYLYYSPDVVPDGSIQYSADGEYNLFLDKDSNLKGIFVEYFKTNLLEHEVGLNSLIRPALSGKDEVKIDPQTSTPEIKASTKIIELEAFKNAFDNIGMETTIAIPA